MPPLRQFPGRPDLDQLRHQARDLQRAAARGDLAAAERLHAVSPRATLSAAQLAIAREHGFASWPRLQEEVARRCTLENGAASPALAAAPAPAADTPTDLAPAARFLIRPVDSLDELAATFDVIGAQFDPAITRQDRRFEDLARRFPEDRPLMLLVEEAGTQDSAARLVGGALAFGGGGITLRAIALEPRVRRQGLGRRLMERIELEAMRRRARAISLGANDESKGFYARLGYAGRGTLMQKGLPLSGPFLEARLRKLTSEASATDASAR